MTQPITLHPTMTDIADHLAHLHHLIATYRGRRRFRVDLRRMAHENPHLIADIGLTKWQAEAEVAKRFWQS